MADKFSKFPSIRRIRISDSYSSNSTDEERKIFRNAETGSTDSDGRLSVVPISASNCSVLARALGQVDIRNQRQDSSASQQGVQATENSEVLGHPASSSSSSSNENSLMEIRAADTVSEDEQVLIYKRSHEQRWVRRRAASSSSTCSSSSSSSSSSGYRSRSPLRAGRPMSIGDSGQSLSPPSSTYDSSES